MTRTTSFLLALVLASPALARDKKNPPPAPEPAPPPTLSADAPTELQALGWMLGQWDVQAEAKAGGESHAFTGTWECAPSSAGFAVLCHFDGDMEGMGPQAETDLMGWNANDGLYHWFSVTNAGEVHDHWGNADGDDMVFQQQGTQDGKLSTERITMHHEGETFHATSTVTVGNQEASVFTATFTHR